MLRIYGFRFSTNVERVLLALGHKGIDVELVPVDSEDRTPVRAASGQDLVPVLDDDGTIVSDSTAILYHLEKRSPEPPLFPADPARRAETDVFLDWFNRVWKRPPNVITGELEKPAPDGALVKRMDAEMANVLSVFENLLAGRAYLMGVELSVADCAAWPFLRYATMPLDPADPWLFHRVLFERQAAVREGKHPRLAAWIDRVAQLPRQEF